MRSKVIFGLSVIVMAACSFAEDRWLTADELKLLEAPYQTLTQEQKAKRNEIALLKNLIDGGGEIQFPNTPRGTIRFVNLQKKVPSSEITRAVNGFGALRDYDCKIVDEDCEASLKVKIVDLPDVPVLLVAPEDKWAQVNVGRLGDKDTKPAFLAARTRKEVMRAFAFLTAGSSYDIPLYGALRSLKRLDRIPDSGLPVDVMMRAKQYLEQLDIVPRSVLEYRNMLVLGYDIAPTNCYQKAIYEEVKKTVKFDKKLK